MVKNPPANEGDESSVPESGRFPREGSGNPPNVLAWETPWTEELGGLQSMGVTKELDTG